MSELAKKMLEHLSQLFSLARDREVTWLPGDLAAIWRHQIRAPLDFDLRESAPGAPATISSLTLTSAQPLQTFGDLLRHPAPPMELLKFTKEFAKSKRNLKDESFPPEIATALYYAAIALAQIRHKTRLTELDDKSLRRGLEWALKLDWLDDETRNLLRQTLGELKG